MPPPPAAVAAVPVYAPRPRIADLIATASDAIRDAASSDAARLEEVALWCAEFGAIDPRLQLAALRQAQGVIARDALIADLIAGLRVRLMVAAPHLAVIAARGDLPRLLVALGLDDVTPPPEALVRTLPPRVARFYWQRLRAFVAWTAARAWAA